MANSADGTDGTGRTATSSGKSVISGKGDSYGGTSSRGISNASKTVSGTSDGSYGTRTGSSSSRFPADVKSTTAVNKNGGR